MEAARAKRSRRRYSEDERARILDAHARSGQGVHAYAVSAGIAPSLVYAWLRRRRAARGKRSSTARSFVPVTITGAAERVGVWSWEIELGDGVRVRAPESLTRAEVVELIRALRA